MLYTLCLQPNVKPQPEEDGGESVSTPTVTTTGVSNVQVQILSTYNPEHALEIDRLACSTEHIWMDLHLTVLAMFSPAAFSRLFGTLIRHPDKVLAGTKVTTLP